MKQVNGYFILNIRCIDQDGKEVFDLTGLSWLKQTTQISVPKSVNFQHRVI